MRPWQWASSSVPDLVRNVVSTDGSKNEHGRGCPRIVSRGALSTASVMAKACSWWAQKELATKSKLSGGGVIPWVEGRGGVSGSPNRGCRGVDLTATGVGTGSCTLGLGATASARAKVVLPSTLALTHSFALPLGRLLGVLLKKPKGTSLLSTSMIKMNITLFTTLIGQWGTSASAHLTRWVWSWGANSTQKMEPSSASWAQRIWWMRLSLSRNHLFWKMLRMSKTERSMTEPLEGLPWWAEA